MMRYSSSRRGGARASSSVICRWVLLLCLTVAIAFAMITAPVAAAAASASDAGAATTTLSAQAASADEASVVNKGAVDEVKQPAAPPKKADDPIKNNGSSTTTTTSHSSRPPNKEDEIVDVTVNPDGSTTTTVRLAPTTGTTTTRQHQQRVASEYDDKDNEYYDEDDEDGMYEEYYDSEDDDEADAPEGLDFDECTRPVAADGVQRSTEDARRCYGKEQSTDGYDNSILLKVDEYMRTVVAIEPKFESVRRHCRNVDALCTYWATLGECEANPGFMLTNCGPACRSCDKFIYEERCPVDPNMHETNAWKPGDLNRFFERLTTHHYYQQFQPNVLCKPGMFNEHAQRDCPWVITLDNFLTDHECDTLIQQGALEGYERSEDVGERNPDGSYGSVQSSGRTSTNAWCSDKCLANETVQGVITKLENLTGIPDANGEFLQLLRYDVGQFYESHHDYIEHDVDRASGPRILTVFLYLNDVEEGGATHFTNLDLAVYPKRGRVLLWPSVLDENPSAQDFRTHHQAQKVLKGIKYGANSWVHLRDFKTPYAVGCT